jgi:transglutaminase-like putative cysteine protease
VVSPKRLSVLLSYLVGLGCFLALRGIALDPVLLVLLILFLAGLLNDLKYNLYPPRRFLTLAGILASLFFLADLNLNNAIQPFSHVLMVLLVLKALEDKKPRDLYQMLLLSLFGVAVSTTFRLDLSFLVFFLYELFLGSVAFLFTNLYANLGDRPVERELVSRYLKFSLLFPLGVGVLSVPFFLVLPRTHTPLFDVFARKERGLISGIADSVEIGKVGEIQQDNTVVMRVYGDLPRDAYWRVSVFDTLLGTRWIRTLDRKETHPHPRGRVVSYTVVLEPTYDTYIPVLDYPLKVVKMEGYRGKVRRLEGGFLIGSLPVSRPVRYRALSVLSPPTDPPQEVHLQVPPGVPESVVNLARSLARGKEGPEEKVRAVAEFFKEGFRYSLKLPRYEGDPLETFLFKTREGNCELFASATALLLRLMGVPTRVVGGFKGYIRNDFGDYYIVTNSMAHVWVEAFVEGRWVRVDTTPPYLSPAVRKISRWDLLRDTLISFWYENVVDFSAEKQVSLARSLRSSILRIKEADLSSLAQKILLFFGIVAVAVSGFYLYTNYLRKSPENLYRKMIRKVERAEGIRLRGLLPEEVLKVLRGRPRYREVEFIVRIYQRHRYSPYGVSKRELEEGYRVLRNIY